jgi:hypothetical protein
MGGVLGTNTASKVFVRATSSGFNGSRDKLQGGNSSIEARTAKDEDLILLRVKASGALLTIVSGASQLCPSVSSTYSKIRSISDVYLLRAELVAGVKIRRG